jgi:hypothetical protein
LEFSNAEHLTGTFLCQHLQKLTVLPVLLSHDDLSTISIKSICSSLNVGDKFYHQEQPELFAQRLLVDQSNVFFDSVKSSQHAIGSPNLHPREQLPIPTLRDVQLLFHCTTMISSSWKIYTNSFTNINSPFVTIPSHSLVSCQVLAFDSISSHDVLILVSDVVNGRQFGSRVRLNQNISVNDIHLFVYNPPNNDLSLLIVWRGEEAVNVVRIPLIDVLFSACNHSFGVNSLPLNQRSLVVQELVLGSLTIVEVNAARGVLFLMDDQNHMEIIDLENNESDNDNDENDEVAVTAITSGFT